ncbi:MAG: hypothetical protein KKF58_00270 [Gammaproteobacteria bacterium]|nr:hypothetical protein [Gammaproteobacteria bacterium]MBU1446720.1 hypothetical protein [Gammaproteobacteria bacterium]
MIDPYKFSYLFAVVSVGCFWLYCYWSRPDLRRMLLRISVIFGIGGVTSEFIYASDWWHPTTLTGTMIGIEDFLFGFFFAGTVAMGYEVVLNKTYQARGERLSKCRFRYIALSILALFFGSTLVFGLHSFLATILAFGLCTAWMLSQRVDLIPNALFSAALGCLLGFIFFGAPELVTPGWVEATWSFDKLSGHFILHMPLEDFFWFTAAGAFIGPLIKFRKNYQTKPRTI